jgi:O-antigen ligase
MGLVFVLVADLKEILMMLGKNSSLSGRTDIWSMVWGKFLERPWLGYGYSAFWMGKDGAQSAGIWEALRWAVPHSHNGFLDILVQVGAVGLIMFFVGYILFFREALRCARASKTILGLFPLLYLTFMILFNCSEGSIIREENMFWVLYATTWALTTRWLALAQTVTRKPVAAVSPVRRPRPIAVPAWRFDATN